MSQSSGFKTQICLADYSYQKDIEYRILISGFNLFEIEVMRAIIDESLKIAIEELAEQLEVEISKLIPTIDALMRTKLFKKEGLFLIVDKEIRKYYQLHISKFDPLFKPNLEFIQNVLNNIPLNILLTWYTISRSSNHIFNSIIHECLSSPKIYRNYLHELQFKDSVLQKIIQDLYQAPNFTLSAKEVMTKYQLSREKFEEYMLILEFHFVCYSHYQFSNNNWHEIITAFAEWHEYLNAELQLKSYSTYPSEKVQADCLEEFSFIKDLTLILNGLHRDLNLNSPLYFQSLENKLLLLDFVKKKNDHLVPTEKGLLWAKKSIQERLNSLAVDPSNQISSFEEANLWNLRSIHMIEKSLRDLPVSRWIDLEDFVKSLFIIIGNTQAVTLQKKGKRWKYALPDYSLLEIEFIKKIIMERCAELGIVKTGSYQEKPCFCLTLFGKQFIY